MSCRLVTQTTARYLKDTNKKKIIAKMYGETLDINTHSRID